jgi:hypothetical protein
VGQLVVAGALITLAALTALLAIASLTGNTERAAQLSREIDALIDKIKSLFEGPPPPEVQEDLEKAKEVLEKYTLPKKEPEPEPNPKYPPPLIPPNVGPTEYERDRKRKDCERKKKEYGWGRHGDVERNKPPPVNGIPYQSHHVLQDAHFSNNRNSGLQNVCAGYRTDDAPAIPALGGTAYPNSPHDKITAEQRLQSAFYRGRFNGPPPGPRPTLAEVTKDGMTVLAAETPIGNDPIAMACLLEYINDYFSRTCPGMTQQSPLRIPWMRPADPGP